MSNIVYENAVKISGFYKDLTYMDQYGSSIVFVIVMVLTLVVTFSYLKSSINAAPMRRDWTKYRCDPMVIPYAGYIYKPDGKTAIEYTGENFQYCLSESLKPMSSRMMAPFDYLIKGLLKVFDKFRVALMSVRGQIDKVRSRFKQIAIDFYKRLAAMSIPLMTISLSTKDLFGKVKAIMNIGFQTAMGFYITLKSLVGNIATGVAVTLIIGASYITMLYGIFALTFFYAPWIAGYALAQAISYTIAYITIMILLVILLTFMKNTMDITPDLSINPPPKGPPAAPKCFDGNMEIEMYTGMKQPIKSVKIGDRLYDGGMVTATLVLERGDEIMYSLHGILVSGTHSVRHRDTWIKVCHHPEAVRQDSYMCPLLYCLNTTTKKIDIGKHVFIDWDEVFPAKEAELRAKQQELGIVCNDMSFVHSHFDGGFEGDTKIIMQDGTCKYIADIRPGDVLRGDIPVYGCVQVEREHMSTTTNAEKEGTGKNTPLAQPGLFHLLTMHGYFFVSERQCADYNHYMDAL